MVWKVGLVVVSAASRGVILAFSGVWGGSATRWRQESRQKTGIDDHTHSHIHTHSHTERERGKREVCRERKGNVNFLTCWMKRFLLFVSVFNSAHDTVWKKIDPDRTAQALSNFSFQNFCSLYLLVSVRS